MLYLAIDQHSKQITVCVRHRRSCGPNKDPSCGGFGQRKLRRLRCYHAIADFARLRLVSNSRLRWATNP